MSICGRPREETVPSAVWPPLEPQWASLAVLPPLSISWRTALFSIGSSTSVEAASLGPGPARVPGNAGHSGGDGAGPTKEPLLEEGKTRAAPSTLSSALRCTGGPDTEAATRLTPFTVIAAETVNNDCGRVNGRSPGGHCGDRGRIKTKRTAPRLVKERFSGTCLYDTKRL
jgi:hypothetical protein